ncbi:meiosis-specific nuclear structural protein 1-like [Frankliniella occidentalis]|uniref:Meiosis-specific nuclear structural protein 1 n=1 Tax=Frankliniella occidentalis TaxID=133901 RepID=A0A6J1S623_FRAOC|nr:meiosis-specific nuclear structural protein 1-like [Frankliniella occidentalis]
MIVNEEEDQLQEHKRSQYTALREKLLADILQKGDDTRLSRRLQLEKHQETLERNTFQDKELKDKWSEKKSVEQHNKDTEKLRADEFLRREKLRNQLRLGTQEIRDLETQLRACYVGKGVHAQMKEKQLKQIREEIREKAHLEAQMVAWKEQEDEDRKTKEENLRQKYALRLAQQEQIVQKQQRKIDAYRTFVQEKLMLDAAVQELIEEDRRNSIARMQRQKACQKDIENFIVAREEWKEKQKLQQEEENKRIQAFVEMQTQRELKLQQEVQRKWEAKAQINDFLARKLYDEQMQDMEKRQVFQELAEEELREAQEARIRQELVVAVQKRIDLRLAMAHQQKERVLQLQREGQREQQMRQEMMEQKATQDRLDQLTAERRRIKIQEHRQAVERLLKERRVRRNLELEQIMRDHEAQLEEEKAREQIIEEERINILQQHAENLLGFMPRGLLKESDIQKLGSNFKTSFENHGVEQDPCL